MSNKPRITRRQFVVRSSLATLAGLGAYAFGVEPRWVSIEKHDLAIPGLPASLRGATAVQISDLHIGSRVGAGFLRQQFEYIESLNPDFVFFTGDYLDEASAWHVEQGIKLMEHFPRGSIGNASVLGNHDFGHAHNSAVENTPNTNRLIDAFADSGLNLLRDESVELGGLKIGGLRDLWFGGFDDDSAANIIGDVARQPSIVLSHNPDTADHPIWNGFEGYVLCGHTHGGQCRFPVVGAPFVPVRNKRYISGFYEVAGGHKLYINRGIGHTRRVRFMARPEITIFNLKLA